MRRLNNKFRGDDAWAETCRTGGTDQAKTREDGKKYQVMVRAKIQNIKLKKI